MNVKIIQPISSYVKTFKITNEFNLFYIAHKAEMDAQTTHILNKMCKYDKVIKQISQDIKDSKALKPNENNSFSKPFYFFS